AAAAPPGRGAPTLTHCLAGLGHELRQRYQRHRSRGTSLACKSRRRFRTEADLHCSRHGLRDGVAGAKLMRKKRSITFLLTLYFSIASTAILLFGGYFVGRLVDQHLMEQDQAVLEGKLELVRNVLSKARTEGELTATHDTLGEALVGHHDLFVAVIAPDGRQLYASEGFNFAAGPAWSVSSPRESGPAQTRVREHDGRPFRFVSAPTNTGIEGAQPAKVLVALDVAFHRQFMTDFRNSLWLTVAVGIA